MKSASTVCSTAGLKICIPMALDGGTPLTDLDAVHRSNKDSAEWKAKNCDASAVQQLWTCALQLLCYLKVWRKLLSLKSNLVSAHK